MSSVRESIMKGTQEANCVAWAVFMTHMMLDATAEATFLEVLLAQYGITIDMAVLTRAFDKPEKPHTET